MLGSRWKAAPFSMAVFCGRCSEAGVCISWESIVWGGAFPEAVPEIKNLRQVVYPRRDSRKDKQWSEKEIVKKREQKKTMIITRQITIWGTGLILLRNLWGDDVKHTPRAIPTWGQGNRVSTYPPLSILGWGLFPGALTLALLALPAPKQNITGFFTANSSLWVQVSVQRIWIGLSSIQ